MSLALLLAAACGDDDKPDPVEPDPEVDQPTGAIAVVTTTGGEFRDADGYLLSINGSGPEVLDANDEAVFGELTPGAYTLELTDLAFNCAASADTTREVEVTEGDTVEVAFGVDCTSAPLIFNPDGPEQVVFSPAGGLAVPALITFDWGDVDANIDSMVVTLVSDPNEAVGTEGQSISYDPGYAGLTRGSASFVPGCFSIFACNGVSGPVTVAYELVDAEGSRSRVEFSYEVTWAPPVQ